MSLRQHIIDLNQILDGTEVVDIDAVLKKSRNSYNIYQRAIIAYYLRKKNFSLQRIGVMLGNRTHATVINALKYGDAYGKMDDYDLCIVKIDKYFTTVPPKICPYCNQAIKHPGL